METGHFTLRIESHADHRLVRSLTVRVLSDNPGVAALFTQSRDNELFGMEADVFAADLTAGERSLLLALRHAAYGRGEDAAEGLVLEAPFDALLLRALADGVSVFKGPWGETAVVPGTAPYRLAAGWDAAQNALVLEDSGDGWLFPTTTEGLVLSQGILAPAPALFSPTVIESLFSRGLYETDSEARARLFERAAALPAHLAGLIRLPRIVRFTENDKIALYLDSLPDKRFRLSAYFIVSDGETVRKYPFLFEELRKTLLLHESVLVPFSLDTVAVAEPDTPFYRKVQKIVQAARTCFYEILNEVSANTITPGDSESLFGRFFPMVDEAAAVERESSPVKIVSGPIVERLVELKLPDTDNMGGKIDWFGVEFSFKVKDIALTLSELKKLIQDGFIEKTEGIVSVSPEELEGLKDFMNGLRLEQKAGKYFISRFNIPYLLRKDLTLKLPPSMTGLSADIENAQSGRKNLTPVPLPEDLSGILRGYQKTGVYWLHFLHRYGFGGILADEMGLGKTLQVLTFLRTIQGQGPSLIVCPTSLIYNWLSEVHKFLGLSMNVVVVDGDREERRALIKKAATADLVITSYPLLHNDIEEYAEIDFIYCVLDEAQHIKNREAKRTQSVKGVRARNRIAMTGTPVENNVWELWSIFDFLMPDFLGAPGWFKKHIESPLNGFDQNERSKALSRLRTAIKPFILRRVKSSVLKELPPKIEQNVVLELTQKQKAVYLDTLAAVRRNYMTAVKERGVENSYLDFLSAITRLRQICLHPGLVREEMEDLDDASIKLKALTELLDECMDSGHRVVVFSQFVEMLTLVRRELSRRGVEYLYLDGRTKDRMGLVDRFNASQVPVFLVSLKAGGTGLNLIGADSVILLDPWWNPAVEDQAIDRVHRLGQLNTVNVYRLLTRGTIEEKIRILQAGKKEVTDALVVNNEHFIRGMKWEDIQSLFELTGME